MSQASYEKIKKYAVEQGISFREVQHEPGASAEEYHNALGCRYEQQAKCLLLKVVKDGQKSWVIAVIPAQKRADLDTIKVALGAESVKMGGRDDLKKETGCDYGELAPLAGAFGLKLVMDKDFLSEQEIYMNAGRVDTSFILDPQELIRVENPVLI